MTKEEFSGALSVVGAAGFMAVVIPGMEKLWAADPHDPAVRARLNTGQAIFTLTAAVIVILGATVYRSWFVFFLGAMIVTTRLLTERLAMNTLPDAQG